MAAIPALTVQSMTQAINLIRPARTFIQDLVFSDHRTHNTEVIEVGYISRGRKMAPMVKKGGASRPIVGHTTSLSNVEGPNIRIHRNFNPGLLAFVRNAHQQSVFPTLGQQTAGIEQHMAIDMAALAQDIANRKEWMAAQALRGAITYAVADGENVTITSPRATANNLVTPTYFWDDATAANRKPETDIEAVQDLINEATGLNATHGLCGAAAARALRTWARDCGYRLDVRGINQGLGHVEYGNALEKSGARYIGTVCNVEFWQYSATLVDEAGSSQAMIRDKYIEFISVTPEAQNRMEFAAIPEDVPGYLFVGETFSKSIREEDPFSIKAIAHTRPLPVLWMPDSTASFLAAT